MMSVTLGAPAHPGDLDHSSADRAGGLQLGHDPRDVVRGRADGRGQLLAGRQDLARVAVDEAGQVPPQPRGDAGQGTVLVELV